MLWSNCSVITSITARLNMLMDGPTDTTSIFCFHVVHFVPRTRNNCKYISCMFLVVSQNICDSRVFTSSGCSFVRVEQNSHCTDIREILCLDFLLKSVKYSSLDKTGQE
jgi:hypothetical protein